MSDAAKVGAGAATGGLSGAAAGAQTGATITAAGGPLTAGAGAVIGGLIGLLGGGLGAYSQTQEDDIPGRGGEDSKCPAGYVYNPATKACQPEGSTVKNVAALRGLKDKEGKSMFDETVRKLVTKPKDSGGAAPAPSGAPSAGLIGALTDINLAGAQRAAGEAEVPAATPKPKVPTGGKGGPTRALQPNELDEIEALLAGATVP
jgi:hypothetical protein